MAMVGTPFRRLSTADGRHHARMPTSEESDTHWALKNISFDVQPGEICAVIGPNGAGKSTLFKIISRITRPTSGYVEIRGRLGSLLEVGTGFHPELTGRENVFLNGAILGMPRREIARKFDEIVGFAEIGHFIDMPVKRYSSGMHIRLAFAVAAHMEPDVLLLDEIMSVGDSEFQKKSQARIEYLTRQGITTLIISHALADVSIVAKRCLYIHKGKLMHDGGMEDAIKLYEAQTQQDFRTAHKIEQLKAEAARTDGFSVPASPVLDFASATAHTATDEPAARSYHPPRRNALTSVTVENQAGETILTQGDDLHVIVRYRSEVSNDPVRFQISIWSCENQLLSRAEARFESPADRRNGDDLSAACVFPALPLRNGEYQVRVVWADQAPMPEAESDMAVFDDQSGCTFKVESPNGTRRPPARDTSAAYDSGIIRLPFQWSQSESPRLNGSLNGLPALRHDRIVSATGSGENGQVLDQAVVLSIDVERAISVCFEYPESPETPVKIIVNSTDAPKSTKHPAATVPGPIHAHGSMVHSSSNDRREIAILEPNSVVGFLDFGVRITSGIEFYTQKKDIFGQRLFAFETDRPNPFVIDAGSQFGMSTLFFKHTYPQARVIAFEPDPALFRLLQENMTRNGLSDVTLINTALGAKSETMGYAYDPISGHLWPKDKGEVIVQVRPLSTFINEPVDFLRLNVNGQEWAVLQELATSHKLESVQTLAVVYQSWPGTKQSLGSVLDVLASNGFRYLIHDFDAQTNVGSKPPFRMTPKTRWSCVVYARQEMKDEIS